MGRYPAGRRRATGWDGYRFWMIKNCNMRPVFATLDRHANINPASGFTFGLQVDLAFAIGGGTSSLPSPGHPQKESSIVVFTNGDID